jgi:class 3 adenylate cyclase/ribosomal protein L40E
MRCSKCGTDNPASNNFCAQCGSALSRLCVKCNAENPLAANFCGKCGAPLAGHIVTASLLESRADGLISGQSEPAPPPEGERKTVTALFADLKGSTELMESLDPEDARAIVDPALRIMVDAVRRYEGYVVQSTGDGIFALFGAPAAYEDHPQRALYAALQMQQQLREHGHHLAAQGGSALEARIGINTGEVVVRTVETGGKVEYTPIGHTANLASRLQAVAPAGAIAVSGAYAQASRRLLRVAGTGASPDQGRE